MASDMPARKLRLGMNIDHVATIRNARGGAHPDPIRAAHMAAQAGADGITAHLREDRRHIRDDDISRLIQEIGVPLNLEMAASDEMVAIAVRHCPHAVCLVPERRQELTTESGLAVAAQSVRLASVIGTLKNAGCRVSLFIDPTLTEIDAAAKIGADIVEFHTGNYCHAALAGDASVPLTQIEARARHAHAAGLEVHAGHGLCYATVSKIAAIPQIIELNIGHFLIGEAIFIGLAEAIGQMRALMLEARAK